jgi:hypothetical protein
MRVFVFRQKTILLPARRKTNSHFLRRKKVWSDRTILLVLRDILPTIRQTFECSNHSRLRLLLAKAWFRSMLTMRACMHACIHRDIHPMIHAYVLSYRNECPQNPMEHARIHTWDGWFTYSKQEYRTSASGDRSIYLSIYLSCRSMIPTPADRSASRALCSSEAAQFRRQKASKLNKDVNRNIRSLGPESNPIKKKNQNIIEHESQWSSEAREQNPAHRAKLL